MRPFEIVDVPQRSPEWFAARLGKLTGSRASDMRAKLANGKEAAGRRNLRVQLMLERLTGKNNESSYTSPAMVQGIEREADAIMLYESLTGRVIQSSGFLQHTQYGAGCSLDGYVGDYEWLVEAKCPTPAIHLDYLTTGTVPKDYMDQCIHALWVTGAKGIDWISFNPDFPEQGRAKLVSIPRDESVIQAYAAEALAFLAEVDAEEVRVRKMLGL